MRRILSGVAVAVLVGSGLAVGAQATAAPAGTAGPRATEKKPYTPPPVSWGACASDSLRSAGAVCGFVKVPLDYAHPRGRKIELAVSKIAHKTGAAQFQGVMLVNPGGPGGSGLELARLGGSVPKNAGDAYDWIGFDPRGVGSSRPSLTCDGDYAAPGRPTYDPKPGIKKFWLTKAARYARACDAARPALLRHDKTTDWVKDMESIRKALGAAQINYYGFSYGTYLGQVYATLHPDRVRRFVFDGVVDPRDVWYQSNLAQERQFDPNIKTFFRWVARHDATYGVGSTGRKVRRVYERTLTRLTRHPGPNFGASDWNDVFVSAAYYVYGWDYYAHVLAAAAKGDLGPAKEAYGDPTGPGADNNYATYLAVQCTDARWPGWRTQERDAYRIAQKHPFLAWNNTWYNAPCTTWAAPSARPVNVKGKGVPPILLIEETHDAATPWAGAIEVRKRFRKSVLIEGVGGTTHAGSLSGVSCTDDKIADYLLTGALPARRHGQHRSDVKCQPVPPPAPTPISARSTARSGTQDRLGDLRQIIADAAMAGR